ncbi:MAG: flippase-like domain-containing protein [Bacteroidetes bacterium]|nr:flippase-like domain-containing protein [Bacteroidota bacterium]
MKFHKLVIVLCIGAIFIYYIYNHQSDFKFLLSINPIFYIPITLLTIVRMILRGVSFYVVLSTILPEISFLNSFKNYIFAQFLPQGGVVYQGMALKKTYGLSYKKFLAFLLAFKVLNILILLTVSSIVITIFDRDIRIGGIPLNILFVLLMVLSVCLIISSWAIVQHYPNVRTRYAGNKIVASIFEVHKTIYRIFLDRKNLLAILIVVTVNGAISVAILFFIFHSIGNPQSIVNLIIYSTTLKLLSMFRITPSNIGVRELLIGYLASVLGASTAEGITVSLIERLVKLFVQTGINLTVNLYPIKSDNKAPDSSD